MSRVKTTTVNLTIEDAVSGAHSDLQSLAEELREWADNMPENMQGGEREEVREFCDELQNVIDEAEGVEFPGMF